MAARADKIKKHLVVDEEQLLEETLERLRKLIALTKDGTVHFVIDRRSLSDRQQIALYLAGKRMAREANLSSENVVTLDKIVDDLLLDSKTATSRLAELKREGLVEARERGQYRASPFAVDLILNEIEGPRISPETQDETLAISAAEIPVIKPTKRTIGNIEQLFNTSWGRKPRTVSEVAKALEVNAIPDSPDNIGSYLRRLVSSGKLRRVEKEGRYAYFKTPT